MVPIGQLLLDAANQEHSARVEGLALFVSAESVELDEERLPIRCDLGHAACQLIGRAEYPRSVGRSPEQRSNGRLDLKKHNVLKDGLPQEEVEDVPASV